MKIVFFGTPEFAVPTLQRLLQETDVLAVVTQPDRPAGRGSKLTASPVKLLAQQAGRPIYQPERLRKDEPTLQQLSALEADFFVVVAYGQILSPRVLAMPRSGCINVHGSLLPHYRGAAPVQWAIYHGETETGITTMLMDKGLDTGPMLLKESFPLTPTMTSEDVLRDLAHIGASLLMETLTQFSTLTPEPQQDALSSYAPLITAADVVMDWSQSAEQLHQQIRAFYPQVHTYYRGERLKILTGHPLLIQSALPPGQITHIVKGQGFQVSTGSGELLITQVQPPGKRVQSAWDFVQGFRLQLGDVLGS
jgi:methionyl-tRNA formyltransferase